MPPMARKVKKRKAKQHLRRIAPPRVVTGPGAVTISGRLRTTPQDDEVLVAFGRLLDHLASSDLVRALGGMNWNQRKRLLTPECSARWAGTITRETNDQIALSLRNLERSAAGHRAAITAIEERREIPLSEYAERKRKREPLPYRSAAELYAKRLRLDALCSRLTDEERQIAGRMRITRGGRALLRNRANLEAAGLTPVQWRTAWQMSRWQIAANGETGKTGGNETIRVDDGGHVLIDLPPSLAHLANAPHHRYHTGGVVDFPYRGGERADCASACRAVGYRIRYSADKRRWHMSASWTQHLEPVAAPVRGRVMGIDLNADHLAVRITDADGNPDGPKIRIPLDLTGKSAERREAELARVVREAMLLCGERLVSTMYIEDLGWADRSGREFLGGRRFRATVHGIPTAALRNMLAAAAWRHNIRLVAVDPAYTSKWAGPWRPLIDTRGDPATTHDAAAWLIARRGRGFRLRRRTGMGAGGQRTARAELPSRPETGPPAIRERGPSGARAGAVRSPGRPAAVRRQPADPRGRASVAVPAPASQAGGPHAHA
jgi:hypothetical protein